MLGRSNMSQNWSAEESNLDRYLIAKLPTEIATGTNTGYNMYQTLLLETTSLGRYYLLEFDRYTGMDYPYTIILNRIGHQI